MSKLIILTLGVLAICGCATQEKTRSLDVTLSGTNSCQIAAKIAREICSAFTADAVTTNGVSAVK